MNENINRPFVSLAKLSLPASSRLLPSACCPDKDLVVIISPQNGKDHVSLWKMQGSKKWQVDVHSVSVRNETIVDLAWSPDGMLNLDKYSKCLFALNVCHRSGNCVNSPPSSSHRALCSGWT
jgi:hypothetical protein